MQVSYKKQLDSLRGQVSELEDSRTQLHVENTLLRQEVKKAGREVPASCKPLTNGCDTPINLTVNCNGSKANGPSTGPSNGPSKQPVNGLSNGSTAVTPKKLTRLWEEAVTSKEQKDHKAEENGTNGKS